MTWVIVMSVCNDCSIKIKKKIFFGSKYHPLRVDKSASREEKSTLLIFLTCSRDSPHPKTQKKTSRGDPTFQKKITRYAPFTLIYPVNVVKQFEKFHEET